MTPNTLHKSFFALSHPLRVRILRFLSREPTQVTTGTIAQCVGEVSSHVCSKHLQILLREGLVTKHTSGQFALWEVHSENILGLSEFLKEISNAESQRVESHKHTDTTLGSSGERQDLLCRDLRGEIDAA